MSAINRELIEKIEQWLAYGDEDLLFAKHGMTIENDTPYRLIAYHAQQCAEKYIKAYLVYHKVDIPYTHNISHLLELLPETELYNKLFDAEELTPFAVMIRYPGEDEPVTESEVKKALEIASMVREIIRAALLKKGIAL